MLPRSLLLVAAAIVLLGTTSALRAENLMLNCSAEEEANGKPASWGEYEGNANVVVHEWGVATDEKHSGKNSAFFKLVKWDTGSKANSALVLGPSNGFTGKKAYSAKPVKFYISFWLKGNLAWIDLTITDWGTENAARNDRMNIPKLARIKPTAEWKRYDYTYMPAPGVKKFVPKLGISGSKGEEGLELGGVIYVDDLYIGTAPPHPSAGEILTQARLEYPIFRGLILEGPGLPLEARLSVLIPPTSPEKIRGGTLRLVAQAGGKTLVEKEIKDLQTSRVTYVIPARNFPKDEPVTLVASLIDKEGKEAAKEEYTLKVVSAVRFADGVYFDANKIAIYKGKKYFPFGWYESHPPSRAGYEERIKRMAEGGFNCLINYSIQQGSLDEIRKYLDALHANGMTTLFGLSSSYDKGKKPEDVQKVLRLTPYKTYEEAAKGFAEAFKDHPALLGWYIADEQREDWATILRARYKLLTDIQPLRIALHVNNSPHRFDVFYDTADVMSPDTYPIPKQSVSVVSDFVDVSCAAGREARPVWAVLQAFNWAYWCHKSGKKWSWPNPARPPTYDECRVMTYLALIHGARGILYYSYYDVVRKGYTEMPWEELTRISKEINALIPVLVEADAPKSDLVVSPDGVFDHLVKLKDGKRTYLVANPWEEALSAKLTVKSAKGAALKVLFEDRMVTLKECTFTDDFPAHGVHVYQEE